MSTIGENIRKLRTERKLTQSEMAKIMGISRNYLSELENNKRNISTNTLMELSEKMSVSMTYLLEGKKTIAEYSSEERKKFIQDLIDKSGGSKTAAYNQLDNAIIKDWLKDLFLTYDTEKENPENNQLIFNTFGFIEHFEGNTHLIRELSNLIYEIVQNEQLTLKGKEQTLDKQYKSLKEQYLRSEVSYKKPLSDPSFPFSNED